MVRKAIRRSTRAAALSLAMALAPPALAQAGAPATIAQVKASIVASVLVRATRESALRQPGAITHAIPAQRLKAPVKPTP